MSIQKQDASRSFDTGIDEGTIKMGAAYQIFGRSVKPHQLSLATLGSAALLVAALSGGKKSEPKSTLPPINASSPEEEDFVKTFLKSIESEESKPAAH
ncbi:hypothetical protein V1511DRAFT_497908 [Dipodascopsis uninucleata]